MILHYVWPVGVIVGQFIISMLVETHVWLACVPGDDNIKSRGHALKLIKAVIYSACVPLWWLLPLSYNNPIGNESVWEEYTALCTYGDVLMTCVCCLYVVEVLYVSIPTMDIITGVHHMTTLLVVYNMKSNLFVLWNFPNVVYGFCFLSGTSTLQYVSYRYHFNRDPLMYKWYKRVGIWIILCIVFFHVNYARALVKSLAQDTPVFVSIARFLLWAAYVADHVNSLRIIYAIHARLKDRCKHYMINESLVIEEESVHMKRVTTVDVRS
jgi:hypothetical protein